MTLDATAFARWRADPASFVEQVMVDPETGAPFVLLPAERAFMAHAFRTNDAGRLLYPEQLFAAPKKSGKTAMAAMHLLTTTLVFGGSYAEGFALANDLEQAQGRVFQATRRIVECSPHLRKEAKVTASRIEFPATGASIQAVASDYAGAAGANPNVITFDELWAFTSERSRRLWDEMVPPPTRRVACRLTTTYAGFEGESTLLEELYRRGLAQPRVDPDLPLHGGNGILMLWSHEPIAPWQDAAWLDQMRGQLRPNAYLRMIENRFVSSDSPFVDMDWFDACVDTALTPVVIDRRLPVWVGVDASVRRDSTAIAAVAWDRAEKRARLIWHRIFQPTRDEPIDFEEQVEETLLGLRGRFAVRGVRYDPFQMMASAQRLAKAGLPMVEYPQTVPNITAASQNLYELVKSRALHLYPDSDIRLAFSRAVAVESARGWKISKDKQSHKIDVVVALGMAAHAAVEGGGRGGYTLDNVLGPDERPQPYLLRMGMATGGIRTGPLG